MTELEKKAKKLYDECPTVKPEWSQLGDVTKSVWINKIVGLQKSKKK